jgi:hypothetical protein
MPCAVGADSSFGTCSVSGVPFEGYPVSVTVPPKAKSFTLRLYGIVGQSQVIVEGNPLNR